MNLLIFALVATIAAQSGEKTSDTAPSDMEN